MEYSGGGDANHGCAAIVLVFLGFGEAKVDGGGDANPVDSGAEVLSPVWTAAGSSRLFVAKGAGPLCRLETKARVHDKKTRVQYASCASTFPRLTL